MNWAGLVARIKAGDQSAGPELVSVLGPQLDLYCERIAPHLSTLNREQAVEIALMKVVQKIDKYDLNRASLPVWARAFVRNALRDVLRDNRETPREHERLTEWLDAGQLRDIANTEGVADLDETIDDQTTLPARHVALLSILMQLPPGDANLLYAHTVEGFPFTLLAERMSHDSTPVTAATLRKRYQRAREKVIEAAKAEPDLRTLVEEATYERAN